MTVNIFGIWIPADDTKPVELVSFDRDDYKVIQNYVGGGFAGLDMYRPECSLFFHDEGKILGLELNRRCSLLLWAHRTEFRGYDAILGNALIVGPAANDGETTSVPDELIDLLFHTDKYRYVVTTFGEEGWHGNQVTFDNWVDAYNGGLALAERWTRVEHVKVVAA